MSKDLLESISNEIYYETANESAGDKIKGFFQKICDSVLWLLRKIKELTLKIITAIKSLFAKKAPSVSSVISSAVREYRTRIDPYLKASKSNPEVISITSIPGLDGYEPDDAPEGVASFDITRENALEGERILVKILEDMTKLYESQFADILSVMGEILHHDDNIFPKQIRFINNIKSMTGALLSTEPLNKSSVDNMAKLKDDIIRESRECTTITNKFMDTKKSNDKIKRDSLNQLRDINQKITEIIMDTTTHAVGILITSIKMNMPNFQRYIQKIEAHAENYKKSADQLHTIVYDIKNYAKTGSALNDRANTIIGYVEIIAKANLDLNSSYGKILSIAKVTTI